MTRVTAIVVFSLLIAVLFCASTTAAPANPNTKLISDPPEAKPQKEGQSDLPAPFGDIVVHSTLTVRGKSPSSKSSQRTQLYSVPKVDNLNAASLSSQ